MENARHFIKRALGYLYNAKAYTYCLGTSGEYLKSSKEKIDYYYSGVEKTNLELLASQNLRAFDCSGLVNKITNAPARYTSSFYNTLPWTTPADGKAGSVLWKPGHVGLDIGSGFFIHIPTLGHTIELGKISEYNWEKSVQVPWADYSTVDNL